ncbi:MAG: hypothetical protein HY746_00290, partial [Elusimicrobia bacterium]|nr:hypothetical protein [Elusimicrobiota bacterium]
MKKTIVLLFLLVFSGYFAFSQITSVPDEEKISFDQLLKAVAQEQANEMRSLPPVSEDGNPGIIRPAGDKRYYLTVKAADKKERTKILETGFDIIEISADEVGGIGHINTVNILKQKGYVITSQIPLSEYVKDFPPADSAYHNYAETIELLQ